MRPRRPALTRYWPLALAALIVGLLYLLTPVLTPFVVAAVLAYILEPLVARLERRGWSRTLAVSLVLLGAALLQLALLLIIIPLFVQQLIALYGYLPSTLSWLRDSAAPWLGQKLGLAVSLDLDYLKDWLASHQQEVGKAVKALLPSLTSGGLALIALAANAVLVPLVLFYFLRDWALLLQHADALTPRRWRDKLHEIVAEVDQVLGEFLRGQLSVIGVMSLYYGSALWLCGLKSALPIGLIAALLVFVPYLGVIVGVLLATLAATLQFQALGGVVAVWGVFLVGQLLEGMVVTPKLVGERIGLHPVAVIFSLMAFGQLFGFVGVLVALPLAAVLLVGLRHVRAQYYDSRFYQQ